MEGMNLLFEGENSLASKENSSSTSKMAILLSTEKET